MWFVFEGLDGSGKSSLIRETARQLLARNVRVEVLSTPLQDLTTLRRTLESLDDIRVLVGFYVASAARTADEARRLISSQTADVVLVDRYIYSTLALAEAFDVTLPPQIREMFEADPFRPDSAFLVVANEQIRHDRLHARGDVREIGQLEDRRALDRAAAAYRGFGLATIENRDGFLIECATTVAEIIQKRVAESANGR